MAPSVTKGERCCKDTTNFEVEAPTGTRLATILVRSDFAGWRFCDSQEENGRPVFDTEADMHLGHQLATMDGHAS